MPKIVVAARVMSVGLIVFCTVPCLAARGTVPETRSKDVGAAHGRGNVRSTTRAPDAPRASCPPRWPTIVPTCTA